MDDTRGTCIAVAILLPDGAGGVGAAKLQEETGLDVVAIALDDPAFPGDDAYPTTRIHTPAATIVAVGVEGPVTPAALLEAAVAASAADARIDRSLLALERADAATAVATGHLMGAWRYDEPDPSSGPVLDGGTPNASADLVARAANWARRLIETPPNLLGPAELADAIIAFAREHAPALEVHVLEGDALAERGFGATIGVGAGSARPPRVVELVHAVAGGDQVGLAGKGITFDAGGMDIKQDQVEISWMKTDMAGAAAVAGAVVAAVALGCRTSIRALLPLADNVPGGTAQRPGDVVRHPGGSTTEVLDTDCEGRLVLADALDALRLGGATMLIDVGTLGDGGGVGPTMWGCWSTDTALAAAVVAAGERVGEPGWRLPLSRFARASLGSRVATRANTAIRGGEGSQLAAVYLADFAADVPWVHIDNGSNAYLEEDVAPWPEGPTGAPVRSLIEFLVTRDPAPR